MKHDDWGWSDPGTLLGVPSPPRSGGRPLPSSSHTWEARMRASVLLSQVLTEAGVTPAVHLRGPAPLAASPTQQVGESGKVLAELAVSMGRGADTHASRARIVMESSGRAGPSVTGNASRREGHAEKERYPRSGENVGNPVWRSARTSI